MGGGIKLVARFYPELVVGVVLSRSVLYSALFGIGFTWSCEIEWGEGVMVQKNGKASGKVKTIKLQSSTKFLAH